METKTVRGTGVVPGYAYAPVGWVHQPYVPSVTTTSMLDEDARPAEVERFKAAVETVAGRFEERALLASGVSAEVLGRPPPSRATGAGHAPRPS